MNKEELQDRTKKFAIEIIQFTDKLPHTRSAGVIGRQLIRSATAVGANYRSALRAKSPADFIAKLSIVLEEADESLYWLEILGESDPALAKSGCVLLKEARELTAIMAASLKTVRVRVGAPNPNGNPSTNNLKS